MNIAKFKFAKRNLTFKYFQTNQIINQHAAADFLDIILLNLESGKNIYQSFEKAALFTLNENIKKCADEVLTRYSVGSTFSASLQNSTYKSNNPFYNEMIENMLLSIQLGTSLEKNLFELSKNMRSQANLKLEEVATQAPVKMVFPLVFFIFPVIFILLGSGSIQDLIRSLRF